MTASIHKTRYSVGTFPIALKESCAQCPELEDCTAISGVEHPSTHYCTLNEQFVHKPAKTNCRQRPRGAEK